GRVLESAGAGTHPAVAGQRDAFFGPDQGSRTVPVLGRAALAAAPRSGPLVVEEADSSTVVHPGWTARCDAHFNLVVEREVTAG
ncbi:MAG TPA: hydantoinase/oxoprolinase family protein, partial [Candidatus Dormibacteraeota bacterium]|nr:hydantoinase/oxoprolinase family protein [Candidatus Dormibacteraeota bacterium]